jgi:hypothetical protein
LSCAAGHEAEFLVIADNDIGKAARARQHLFRHLR